MPENHKDKNDIPNELARFKDTHHIHDSPTKTDETHTGIIALIDEKYSVTDVKEIMQGRILSFQLSDPSTKLAYQIIAVYLPTNQILNRDNMQDIVRRLRLNNRSDNTLILGDFNSIHHPKDKKCGLSQKDRQLNEIWIPFLDEMDLVDPF